MTTVKEFSEKYDVPTSTLYYLVNNGIVKLRNTSTKYGKRKKFKEQDMLSELERRLIPYTLPNMDTYTALNQFVNTAIEIPCNLEEDIQINAKKEDLNKTERATANPEQ